MEYFDKHYHPPGTAPGTLVQHEPERPEHELQIHLINYDRHQFVEEANASFEQCQEALQGNGISWIHFQGQINPEVLATFGKTLNLHPLALEDILNQGQRPKADLYDEQLFVSLWMTETARPAPRIEQISLFLGEGYVVSFYRGINDPFTPLRQRLRKQTGLIRSASADYLFYGILDLVIDLGYPLIENYSDQITEIENELITSATDQTTLLKIHQIRRELLLYRRYLLPQRDVINHLINERSRLIDDNTRVYLRDCYDHANQIMDHIDHYREMSTGLIELYLSTVSQRMNEVMRVLTMIATIFIPLSLVAGIYGMNFEHPNSPWAMPELGWYYGYPFVWLVMLTIVAGLVLFFKNKKWL